MFYWKHIYGKRFLFEPFWSLRRILGTQLTQKPLQSVDASQTDNFSMFFIGISSYKTFIRV